jgi:hypothetical protein
VWFATIVLIIGGPWQQIYYVLATGDTTYSEESTQQASAILYGIAYSIAHPLEAIVTVLPLPFNLTLIIMDFSIWCLKLILWQTWYAMEITLWYMDFFYQFSVKMILHYDNSAAFLRW